MDLTWSLRDVLSGHHESRATTYQDVWGADLDNEASPRYDGAVVTPRRALGLSAVYACVSLLADTVATLPPKVHERDGKRRLDVEPQPEWLEQPIPRDPSVTGEVHFGQVVTSMYLDGNAFTLVSPNVFQPAEIRVIDPRIVEIERKADSSINYHVDGQRGDPSDDFDWTQMLHTPLIRLPGELRGLSPLEAERRMFNGAISAEELATRFLRSGTWLSAVLEMPPTWAGDDTEQAKLREAIEARWSGTRNSGHVGILTGGAKLTQLSVTPEQAQFLETRQYDDERIFRIFRCPPALVGMTKEGATSYASSVMQADAFEKHTIRPLLSKIEASYGRLLPVGQFLRFNTGALLRADLMTRINAYTAGLQNKFLTVDEVRAKEDMDPYGDVTGGFLETPNNNAPDPRFEAVGALIRAGFEPASALVAVGLPPIKHTGSLPVTVQGDAPGGQP